MITQTQYDNRMRLVADRRSGNHKQTQGCLG